MTRFIQIHWLASYPGTLLNRDDAGLAKRLPFGGVTRSRVSSQCLKRHWRFAGADTAEQAKENPWALQNLEIPLGVRTKEAIEKRVMPKALESVSASEEIPVAVQEAVQEAMLKGVYGKNAVDKKKRQALFLGEPELDYLASLAAKAFGSSDAKTAGEAMAEMLNDKDEKKNIRELAVGAGLGAALFGRMVTSDVAANTDAAIHVAHALSVHRMERDLDFVTVVDDLNDPQSIEGDDAGAAGLFDIELTSALYYGYVVVDVALLVSNLAGDEQNAAKVVEHLVHLIAEVSPGAKKGSTAPYAWAEHMLIEAGDRQPRTLSNAFRDPITLSSNSLLESTLSSMNAHVSKLDDAYGTGEQRKQMAVETEFALHDVDIVSLDELSEWCGSCVSST